MIRAEINELETKETITNINETKSWFFEKINKIEKPLARLIKKKRERTQIHKIRNEKEVTTEIQMTRTDYQKQLLTNKLDNLEKKGQILKGYNLSRLNQEDIENMKRPITSTEI